MLIIVTFLLLVRCPLLAGGFPPARHIRHVNKVSILFYSTAPYCEEAEVQDVNARLDQRARQRMTLKPPMKLLSPKACVKIGQWKVRTMLELGKGA